MVDFVRLTETVTGLNVKLNGEELVVNLFVTKGALDTHAKAGVLNMRYFDGFFGCSVCETPGIKTKKGKGSNHSYCESVKKPATLRTHDFMMRNGERGTIEVPVGLCQSNELFITIH